MGITDYAKIYTNGKFGQRLAKFLIIGCSAALVNLGLMIVFVEAMGFHGYYLKNVANILAIEISIIYNFVLSRRWTWGDAPKKQGKRLFLQLLSFNLTSSGSLGLRVAIFAILEGLGVFYLLNVTIGIGVGAILNFVLYDKLIFRR